MSIKDAALRFGVAVENELIQAKADQMEMAQDLTERINGVADRVKKLDAKVTAHNEAVMTILVDIQRKLNAA